MKIKELKQQRLEERQFAREGLLIAILGVVFTFTGMYLGRGMEVGYSQANQEVKQAARKMYDEFNNSPQIRMQY